MFCQTTYDWQTLVNKLPCHMPKVLLALVTSLILPFIIYQSLYWLLLRHIVNSVKWICTYLDAAETNALTPLPLHQYYCIPYHRISSLTFFISAAFMAMVNHWCTVLTHCELITADQMGTSSTLSDHELAFTQTWLGFQTHDVTR